MNVVDTSVLQAGAKQVLQGILADLDQSMGLAGIVNIEGCNRSMIRKVAYGGDGRPPVARSGHEPLE